MSATADWLTHVRRVTLCTGGENMAKVKIAIKVTVKATVKRRITVKR